MSSIENHRRFWPRHRGWLWTGLTGAAVLLLASFMSRGDAVPVRAAKVLRSTIRSVVSTNGKVEPLAYFEAHAPMATTVKRLLVREGDRVRRGQPLVEMDDAAARSVAAKALAQIRASQAAMNAVQSGGTQEEVFTVESELRKARTTRDTAQRNLDVLEHLEKDGAASAGEVKAAEDQLQRANADLSLLEQKQKDRYSRPEVTKVEAQLSEAQAAYDAAQTTLDQLNIRAPFDGMVYSLPVLAGAYVNSGDLILEEADLSKVRVRAFVDEPDVGRLVPGDAIEVTWDAMPGRIWSSTVTALPTVIKLHSTRNVGETVCVVDNHDFKLLPNVNVGVTIITGEHQNVLTVPREAVHEEDGSTYVYQIMDNELHRRDVQTSIANLTQVEVTGGLQENALVALAPLNTKPLHDGLVVKVVR
ncbi:MAG TPA: efflux RND transporter periplasmic adaptor subunit [Terriglobales bacterium]|nr:efflux RND transporter periplasmic adaptor subunit [Terriglobales bacterium]